MLKLKPNPTFKAKVEIHVPGESTPAEVKVEFKHKTKDELEAFFTGPEAKGRSDVDTVLSIACGWEGVDAPFDAENLATFFANYHGAARAIVVAYTEEITAARRGN